MEKEILVKMLSDLGFPIFVTLVSVYASFLTLKVLLSDVLLLIKKIIELIESINQKIKNIENDISILDILITSSLGVKIDLTQFTRQISRNEAEEENGRD